MSLANSAFIFCCATFLQTEKNVIETKSSKVGHFESYYPESFSGTNWNHLCEMSSRVFTLFSHLISIDFAQFSIFQCNEIFVR